MYPRGSEIVERDGERVVKVPRAAGQPGHWFLPLSIELWRDGVVFNGLPPLPEDQESS